MKKHERPGRRKGGKAIYFVAICFLFFSSCRFEGKKVKRYDCDPVPEGRALAAQVFSPSQLIGGRSAQGMAGDFKLQNSRISVIVSHPEHRSDFIPFGGYIVDAAPVGEDGCPLPEDHFGEMGMVVGKLDFADITQSAIRGFEPSSITIVSDGSAGGPAVIRVTGTDAWIPLIETGILLLLPDQGFSSALNLEIQTDYILPPDSNIVEIVSTVTNPPDGDTITTGFGDAFMFGDGMTTTYPDATYLYIAPLDFELFTDIKFLVSSNGEISYAYGLDKRLMSSITIQNVTPALDQSLLDSPVELGPGQSATFKRYLAVTKGDGNSAAQEFYPLWGVTILPFSGRVEEEGTGQPVAGARVEILHADTTRFVSSFMTGEDGTFAGALPAGTYDAYASAEERVGSGPVRFSLPPHSGLTLTVGPTGHLSYDIRDDTGENIPAKLLFLSGGAIVKRVATASGAGEVQVLPGRYEVWVSHGMEYDAKSQSVFIPEGGDTVIAEFLTRVVDTSGFIAGDFHLHAEPSPDSDFPLTDRIKDCAAEGLEVAVATDHDVITDYGPTIRALGLTDKLVYISGEEVSSPVLGHFIGFPLNRNPALRGNGAVDWFRKSAQETFDALRALGAKVVQVNHPREEDSGYFNAILYDRTTGTAQETNPGHLGLDPGDTILSFDFNAMEVINGKRFKQTFINPGDPSDPEQGTLQDWFSLLNMGLRVTATGNSDSHRISQIPGMPRNYIQVPDDDPARARREDIYAAIQNQRNIVSLGAFIRMSANGIAGLGETLTDTDGSVDLHIQVQSPPWVDVTKLVVFRNCSVETEIDILDQNPIVKYDGIVSVNITEDSWFVVMAQGQNDLFPVAQGFNDQAPRALTNPVYVDFDGNGVFDPPGLIPCNSQY